MQEISTSELSVPKVWKVPRQNTDFIGREQLLDPIIGALPKILTEKSFCEIAQVIAGSGGVGKSQLAREYAHRFKNHYQIVWWIDLNGSLKEQYFQLAIELDKNFESEKKEPREILENMKVQVLVSYVNNKLRIISNWLLIFDDAKDEKSINDLIPQYHSLGRGHVLITSRFQGYTRIPIISLSGFSTKESIKLLNKILTPNISDSNFPIYAHKLAELLHNYPHAVALAGYYIKLTHTTSLEDYCEKYIAKRGNIGDKKPKIIDYERTLNTTWSFCREQFPADKIKVLEEFLCAISALSPTEIPILMLKEIIGPTYSNDDIDEVINYLKIYSAIEIREYNNKERYISIHPVLQLVLRNEIEHENLKFKALQILDFLEKKFSYNSDLMRSTISVIQIYVQHVEFLLNLTYEMELYSLSFIDLHIQYGSYCDRELSLSAKSESLLNIAFDIVFKKEKNFKLNYFRDNQMYQFKYSNDYYRQSIITELLGNVFFGRGRGNYKLANKYYCESLRLIELCEYKIIIQNGAAIYNNKIDPSIKSAVKAIVLHQLGNTCSRSYRYKEATKYYKQSYDINQNINGGLNIYAANNLHELSFIQSMQDQHEKAIKNIKWSLFVKYKFFGRYHPDVGLALDIMGAIYYKSGELSKCYQCYLLADKIMSSVYQLEHIQVVAIKARLEIAGRLFDSKLLNTDYERLFWADLEEEIGSSSLKQGFVLFDIDFLVPELTQNPFVNIFDMLNIRWNASEIGAKSLLSIDYGFEQYDFTSALDSCVSYSFFNNRLDKLRLDTIFTKSLAGVRLPRIELISDDIGSEDQAEDNAAIKSHALGQNFIFSSPTQGEVAMILDSELDPQAILDCITREQRNDVWGLEPDQLLTRITSSRFAQNLSYKEAFIWEDFKFILESERASLIRHIHSFSNHPLNPLEKVSALTNEELLKTLVFRARVLIDEVHYYQACAKVFKINEDPHSFEISRVQYRPIGDEGKVQEGYIEVTDKRNKKTCELILFSGGSTSLTSDVDTNIYFRNISQLSKENLCRVLGLLPSEVNVYSHEELGTLYLAQIIRQFHALSLTEFQMTSALHRDSNIYLNGITSGEKYYPKFTDLAQAIRGLRLSNELKKRFYDEVQQFKLRKHRLEFAASLFSLRCALSENEWIEFRASTLAKINEGFDANQRRGLQDAQNDFKSALGDVDRWFVTYLKDTRAKQAEIEGTINMHSEKSAFKKGSSKYKKDLQVRALDELYAEKLTAMADTRIKDTQKGYDESLRQYTEEFNRAISSLNNLLEGYDARIAHYDQQILEMQNNRGLSEKIKKDALNGIRNEKSALETERSDVEEALILCIRKIGVLRTDRQRDFIYAHLYANEAYVSRSAVFHVVETSQRNVSVYHRDIEMKLRTIMCSALQQVGFKLLHMRAHRPNESLPVDKQLEVLGQGVYFTAKYGERVAELLFHYRQSVKEILPRFSLNVVEARDEQELVEICNELHKFKFSLINTPEGWFFCGENNRGTQERKLLREIPILEEVRDIVENRDNFDNRNCLKDEVKIRVLGICMEKYGRKYEEEDKERFTRSSQFFTNPRDDQNPIQLLNLWNNRLDRKQIAERIDPQKFLTRDGILLLQDDVKIVAEVKKNNQIAYWRKTATTLEKLKSRYCWKMYGEVQDVINDQELKVLVEREHGNYMLIVSQIIAATLLAKYMVKGALWDKFSEEAADRNAQRGHIAGSGAAVGGMVPVDDDLLGSKGKEEEMRGSYNNK